MRLRYPLSFALVTTFWACIPHPGTDFEDYGVRATEYLTDGGGSFEGSTAPTESVKGTYYVACLCQLAFYKLSKVFNFYSETSFVADPAGGGKLSITLQPLALSKTTNGPPEIFTSAGLIGEKKDAQAPANNVDGAEGRYSIDLQTMTLPGEANPITGRAVIIANTKLTGFFGKERFCARLNGDVTQPLLLTLEPEKNICQFFPITEGGATPTLVKEDFEAGSCPF